MVELTENEMGVISRLSGLARSLAEDAMQLAPEQSIGVIDLCDRVDEISEAHPPAAGGEVG